MKVKKGGLGIYQGQSPTFTIYDGKDISSS